jgi:arylsulfatase A-like enzyme
MCRRLLTAAVLLLAASSAAAAPRPNVVLVLTDDLSTRLMPYLPGLRRMVAEPGLELGMVVTTPVCAPSRASILTGKYAHNHRVSGNLLAPFRHRGGEESTFAVWLQRAGYTTGYFGKYLNGYGVKLAYVPPGWDRWASGIRLPNRSEYEVLAEGGARRIVRGVYDVDFYAGATRRFVATAPEPFIAVWAPLAPHGPFNSAPRHRGRFDTIELRWPPSFSGDEDAAAKLLRTRLEMMLAVEEGVAGILRALERRGALEHTYVFFTSDNGVFMGEHGLDAGKGLPYEEASRVPLYVRGPGVRVGRSDALVGTHDLAPTFAELAGVPLPDDVDGTSMVPLFAAEPAAPWRERLLLEFWVLFRQQEGWQGLLTRDVKYARWNDGRCMVLDVARDPDELHPRSCSAEDAPYARAVRDLAACRGRACGRLEGGVVGVAAALEDGLDVARASCDQRPPALVPTPAASRAPSLLPGARELGAVTQ